MSKQGRRRDFLKLGGTALAAGAGGIGTALPGAVLAGPAIGAMPAALPPAKGPRLVIVGGGTSGLTIAKYARREYPRFDVVLVEKRDMYASCFASNLWYADLVDLEFLAGHSFLDAAVNNGYLYFNATATQLDRDRKTLHTSAGTIRYDFLVVAPGIAYDYERIGVSDIALQAWLRQNCPGGFLAPTEHVTIRRQVQEFKGGVFIQTVPSGNYRCLPAPYERACLIAATIRRRGLAGKVLILDANPEITIKPQGFHAAFEELYKDIIEWYPDCAVTGVDPAARVIETEFDSYPFDAAAIYPNVRASRLIEQFGMLAPSTRSAQKEADIDTRFYNLRDDLHVYASGDSRPQPYSKSANTSNTEGRYLARVLAARAQDREVSWQSPETLCYSMVNADPMEAIAVDARYDYSSAQDAITGFSADTVLFEQRDTTKGAAALEWARGLYRDMFLA